MTPSRRTMAIGGAVIAVALLGSLVAIGLPRWRARNAPPVAGASAPAAPAPVGRRIKAHLFYVAEDGVHLTSVERDVQFGEGAAEQARWIVESQIAPADEPLVSAVPAGTKLRALFISGHGQAFVDFSQELASGHSGGSLDELLTVYTIVNALTANLPAVTTVQILVNGKELDTLAGHVDLRRPLEKNLAWVQ